MAQVQKKGGSLDKIKRKMRRHCHPAERYSAVPPHLAGGVAPGTAFSCACAMPDPFIPLRPDLPRSP